MTRLLLVAIIAVFFLGCMKKPSSEIEKGMAQAVSYVEEFRKINGRLPADDEFRKWRERVNPVGVIQIESKTSSDGMSFYVIYSWAGEKMWEYSSLSRKMQLQK